jgi:predicted DNA-binding ribbon-helix-helix protein
VPGIFRGAGEVSGRECCPAPPTGLRLPENAVTLDNRCELAGGTAVKSAIVKRAVVIDGHKTSITLEDDFWDGLREIAKSRNLTTYQLVSMIKKQRRRGTLSSAIRLCVFDYYYKRAA